MDFQQLIQQASANQVLVEKKHVLQKKQKEVKKKREIQIQHTQQKKTAERLKVMKEAALRKQLEYKGLASHTSRPLITSTSSTKQVVETSTHAAASRGNVTKEKNLNTIKASCSSTKPGKPPKTKRKEIGSSTQVQKSNSSKISQPCPDNQSKTKVKPSPVANFQDLLKIAQTNSKSTLKDAIVKPNNKSSIVEETRTKGSPSPVGKLLLERSSQRSKTRLKVETNAEPKPSERSRGIDSSSALTSKSKVLLSHTRDSDLVRRPLRDPTPSGSTVMAKNHSNITPNRAHVGDGKSCQTSTTGSKLPQSCSTSGSQAPVRGFKTPSIPLSLSQKQLQQQRKERMKAAASAKVRTSQAPHSKPLNATVFYGAAAARILGKDGRFSGSRYAPAKYTSSWVGEMTDYLRSEDMDDTEDEDEDLEGFLDDDFIDDSGAGEDYSSAIREIFGYDKRRFTEERFDDAAMESSYAQQEFEEKRSCRLGQLEDEEELRREQGQVSRKRKKTGGKEKVSNSKQIKLNFK